MPSRAKEREECLTLQSDDPDIFAGGDAIRGPSTLVEAIADGRRAAVSIDTYVRGLDLRLDRDARLKVIAEPQKEDYNPALRALAPRLAPRERVKSFDEVDRGFTEDVIVQEAQRCISCGSCCVQACPYDVMQLNHESGKAVKCDLCVEKQGNGEAPACTTVCPTRCVLWGDSETFPSGIQMVR